MPELPVTVAQTPDSWGIERPEDPNIPPWKVFLDQVAAAGYSRTELGPLGYLPVVHADLRHALATRRLGLIAGYIMRPWSNGYDAKDTFTVARTTCELLAATGAKYIVLIDALAQRAAVAGRADAPRLDPAGRARFVDTLTRVASVAKQQFGLTPVFHPHAGTYVEFDDEIEWLLGATDPDLIGLCIDTGHSLFSAIDPVTMCRKYASRLQYLHFKDVDQARLDALLAERGSFDAAVAKGVFCRLGEGSVDFEGIVDALIAIGYTGWAAVEQDRLTPAPDDPQPADDAIANRTFLTGLGFRTTPSVSAYAS